MARAVQCPSCGAESVVQNPGITALQCPFCKTLIYWDAEAVRSSGQKAVLDTPSSALRVGGHCTLQKQDMSVLGRVRYQYGGGVWDEWFLEGADGKIVWLTEDEKEFAREHAIPVDPSLPAFEQLRPGQRLTVHGAPFVVEEVGKAACLGVEGQLPFVVIPNDVYPFADLASPDGKASLGIEYNAQGAPSLFQGAFLARDALLVDDASPYPTQVAAAAGVQCAGCGTPVDGTYPPDTKMLVCRSCGAGLELNATQTRGVMQNGRAPNFGLAIGDKGALMGTTFEVVGRLHYTELDEDGTYTSQEYLLWDEKAGYRWLEDSSGHWTLMERSHVAPEREVFGLAPHRKVKVGSTQFSMVEEGEETLEYVDGALPWVAQVGERFRYADLTAPPRYFCVELSATGDSREVEYFEGTYVPAAVVGRAFKKQVAEARGVGVAQPFVRTPAQSFMLWMGILATVVNLALFAAAEGRSGRVVLRATIDPAQYKNEWLSEPFAIRYKPAVVSLRGQAGLDNAWLALDLALVDDQDRAVLAADGDMGYYHGYEDGESWSEGSTDFSELVVVDKPGLYKLLVYGNAGRGDTESAEAGFGVPVTIEVREGIMASRYLLIMAILAALYPLKEILRKRSFEKQRIPDDDDDD